VKVKRVALLIFILIAFKGFSFFRGDSLRSDSLIAYAKKFLGTRYKWASADPKNGFDCSGFTYYVFNKFGLAIPRSSSEYEKFGKTIKRDSARKGDIIVFTGTNPRIRRAGHVGLVISNPGEELAFIQCSSSKKRGGVIISTFISSPYYEKRFIRICRLPEAKVNR
jgi:cell wall-associated NlpC family hydrolase